MSTVQRIAQLFGLVFLVVGILGFFLGSRSMDMGMLLGLFPVNLLHNVVHCLFGIWGLTGAKSFSGAKSFAQLGGVIYIVLAVIGKVSPDGFGLVPLGGNDIWLHAGLGVVLAFFGFTASQTSAGA
jgi:hypothetical protein